MRPRPFLLLLAGFALALVAAGEADARDPEWSYIAGGDVRSAAISADGEYIAAGSQNDRVYLFDKGSSTPLWSYTTGDWVYSVAISADGEYIAAGSRDYKVYLFDRDSSTPLWSYTTGDWVYSVAISADGEYIAAGSADSKIHLFDKDSSTPLWSYQTEQPVVSVDISADGEYIAACTGGWEAGKVYLFDKDSSTPLWSYSDSSGSNGSGNGMRSVAISADGEYITAGTQADWGDGKVYFFDKDSSTPLWSYTAGNDVDSVAISADGEYIAAGSDDDTVYLFDKDSSTPLWSYTTGADVRSVSISADGEYIVAGSWNDRVYLFDKGSSTPLWSYTTGDDVRSVVISADGEYIAAGGYDDKVYLFHNNMLPIATIDSITPSPANEGVGVSFVGSGLDSDGAIVGYQWRSSIDGDLSTASSFSTSSLSVGEHSIFLKVQDDEGEWSAEVSQNLQVNNVPPAASIDSISPSPAGEGEDVNFVGSGSDSAGSIVGYEWYSDVEGLLGNVTSFSKNDLSVGNHTITFRVQDDEGEWSGWETAELFVYTNMPPVASIGSIVPSPAEKGVSVTLTGLGTDRDGTIVAYQWISDIDGALSTEATFSLTNLSLGNHTITFRVQDSNDTWSADSDSLFVFAFPVAIAGYDATVKPGDTVQFTGAGTDEDGVIEKYEWDFDGDGVYEWSSSNNGIATYAYETDGGYTATLRVTDNHGFTSTGSRTVTVVAGGSVKTTVSEGGLPGIPLVYGLAIIVGVVVVGGGGIYWWKRRSTLPSHPSETAPPAAAAAIFTPTPENVTIECPGCSAQMKVPKLGKMQTVTCDSCDLSGEIEI
jgi:WD40 repeat protein